MQAAIVLRTFCCTVFRSSLSFNNACSRRFCLKYRTRLMCSRVSTACCTRCLSSSSWPAAIAIAGVAAGVRMSRRVT
jgi:hypothetical protein